MLHHEVFRGCAVSDPREFPWPEVVGLSVKTEDKSTENFGVG